MSLTLERVKEYLRIDAGEEDALLEALMKAAEAYLVSAIGGFRAVYEFDEEFASKADLVQLMLTAEYYQNRSNDPRGTDFTYAMRALISQLQLWTRDFGERWQSTEEESDADDWDATESDDSG